MKEARLSNIQKKEEKKTVKTNLNTRLMCLSFEKQ